MFLKVMCTVVALAFAALVALQSRGLTDIRLFSSDISVPVSVVVCSFLILGFGIGMIWRNVPKAQSPKVKTEVPIIADLKVCK